ncbi:hypothetical protein HBI61_082960 [Parastagonospora nodorum]|nr:hypothetical protein HBI20_101820 [Parastagonospora nodorum]KAH6182269.1 hypothetical protein HBI61_082960 [Parastagonospora nodorum]
MGAPSRGIISEFVQLVEVTVKFDFGATMESSLEVIVLQVPDQNLEQTVVKRWNLIEFLTARRREARAEM